MSSNKKLKTKTSYLWSYYNVVDSQLKTAQCDTCGQVLNFKSTITNLRQHIEKRHPTVSLPNKDKPTNSSDSSYTNTLPGPSSLSHSDSTAIQSNKSTTNSTCAETDTVTANKSNPLSQYFSSSNNQSSIKSFLPKQKIE